MPPVGLEPTAIRLKVCCSNQLSYRGLSSPGPLARAHAQGASGGTVRAAVCEGIQRPACLYYRPRSPLTRPASHVRLARQVRQQTRVQAVQPRVTVDDNALWAVQDLHLRPSARDAEALLPELTAQKPAHLGWVTTVPIYTVSIRTIQPTFASCISPINSRPTGPQSATCALVR